MQLLFTSFSFPCSFLSLLVSSACFVLLAGEIGSQPPTSRASSVASVASTRVGEGGGDTSGTPLGGRSSFSHAVPPTDPSLSFVTRQYVSLLDVS